MEAGAVPSELQTGQNEKLKELLSADEDTLTQYVPAAVHTLP